jgi:nucleotide-binding universal stress UspA family protein
LIAYDGSDDARAAVRRAGAVLAVRDAVVVTVWESAAPAASAARAALPDAVVVEAVAKLDAETRRRAEQTAAEGAELAREAGLEATPAAVQAGGRVWSTILAEADDRDAAVVVVGSRGSSPVKAALLGSVSAGVSTHSARPVLIGRA